MVCEEGAMNTFFTNAYHIHMTLCFINEMMELIYMLRVDASTAHLPIIRL